MPILRTGPNGSAYLEPVAFENEAELERVLTENPRLMVPDGAIPPILVASQVVLPEAGRLDLLFINDDALPIAVETKLARNRESRREVALPAKIAETLYPPEISVEGGEVSGR